MEAMGLKALLRPKRDSGRGQEARKECDDPTGPHLLGLNERINWFKEKGLVCNGLFK